MPKFFKLTLEDIDELYNICDEKNERQSLRDYNDFVEKKQYYTCTNCGKEELYVNSPVVEDEIWEDACKGLGIKYLNGKNNKSSVTAIDTGGMNHEQIASLHFYNHYKTIRTVTPDSEYTMLCRSCIEKGIGRKLYKEDLVDCKMTRGIIDKFESKPIKPFKDF